MKGTLLYATAPVVEVVDVGPHLRRVVLGGAGLAGFRSIAPDQQVKLFFARDGGVPQLVEPPTDMNDVAGWYARYLATPEPVRPWMRTYTVRRHSPTTGEIEVDFVLHADTAGPASRWAAAAAPGDVVGFLGPAPSHYRPPPARVPMLFAGDETALPAIAAWLESLGGTDRATVHVEVGGPEDEIELDTAAQVTVHWHHRAGAAPGTSPVLLDAVRADGPTSWAWLAGEAATVRGLRRHLVGERGMDRRSVAFAGYWRRHLTQDDAPTSDDAADAAEVMAEAGT